ncbi:uncharacterized protein LOC108668342 [Hyalella azteca]|uniref:Uncharacterized protein LOC108668342 n=1 Tax=Hyalella azteca TaxID=294128 RepID=A0A8B7NBR4_HYAAZ|nr:uncharacterized protein LOC108668342 [Hyalella azteca]
MSNLFFRCITPERLERHSVSIDDLPLRRATSEGHLDRRHEWEAAIKHESIGGRVAGQSRRSTGRFEAEFSSRLTHQLDVVTRAHERKRKVTSKSTPKITKLEPQEDVSAGRSSARKNGAGRARKKTVDGRLDDPRQTAVSQGDRSKPNSAKKSDPGSPKPSSAHARPDATLGPDDLWIDPKDFLSSEHVSPDMADELTKLKEEFEIETSSLQATGAGKAADKTDLAFWLSLPRCASHRHAVCTLPVQLHRLEGMTPLSYLETHLQVSHDRSLLFGKVFAKFKDSETGLLSGSLSLGRALSLALGGDMLESRLDSLLQIVPPPLDTFGNYAPRQFIVLAAIAERLFAEELRPAELEVQTRDLVEQLDFHQIQDRLRILTDLQPPLRNLLIIIRDLGNNSSTEERCL